MSDNPEETAYFLRLISMYIDLGTETVVKVFYHLTPKQNVKSFFSSSDVQSALKTLYKDKILSYKEYKLVSYNPNPDNFDISLLVTLLTNLYIGKLPAPTNGWKFTPDSQDFSIAADLLRLRNIRNTIVAHQPRARLFKVKFDCLWKRVEDIILRLIREVDSASETILKEKIDAYKEKPLDPQNDGVQEYLEKIRDWWKNCEEISKLQEQVESLVKKTQEFVLFFKSKPERYFRYIKLLFDGGRLVLSGQLASEVSKQNESLEMILGRNQDFLKDKFSNEQMYKQLFQGTEENTIINTNIETWDITVVAIVIISVFSESIDEVTLTNVSSIMEARNDYANTALMALDSELFTSCCEDLLSSIRVLSSRLGNDIYKKCNDVIEVYKKKSESNTGDVDHYFEELRRHGSEIKTIAEVYTETVDKLKDSVKQMEADGIDFKREHVLELKMVTLGNNKEKKKVAEDTLETVWQAALKTAKNPEEFEAVRQALDMILNDIRRIPDVKVEQIVRHCILLHLRCFSWRGLLLLIEYFNSSDFECHLKRVADELYFLYNDVLVIPGNLTAESILDVLRNLECPHDEPQQFISLPIQCTSAEGMRQVLDIVEKERTINRFNEIAESLSEQVGDKIFVSVSSDVGGFSDVFEEESEHSSSNSFGDDVNNVDSPLKTSVIPVDIPHYMSKNDQPDPDRPRLSTDNQQVIQPGKDDLELYLEKERRKSRNSMETNKEKLNPFVSLVPEEMSLEKSSQDDTYFRWTSPNTDNQQLVQLGKDDLKLNVEKRRLERRMITTERLKERRKGVMEWSFHVKPEVMQLDKSSKDDTDFDMLSPKTDYQSVFRPGNDDLEQYLEKRRIEHYMQKDHDSVTKRVNDSKGKKPVFKKQKRNHPIKRNLDAAVSQSTFDQENDYRKFKTDLKDDMISFYRRYNNTVALSPLVGDRSVPLLDYYVVPSLKAEGANNGKPVLTLKDIFLEYSKSGDKIYLSAPAGMGKSTFAKHMVLTWCQAHEPDQSNSFCIEDIEAMSTFQYCFFINLKQVGKYIYDIDSMVETQILSKLLHCRSTTKEFLSRLLCEEHCLFVLDGLDESIHHGESLRLKIPNAKIRPLSTYLTTTRVKQHLPLGQISLHLTIAPQIVRSNFTWQLAGKAIKYLNKKYNGNKNLPEFMESMDEMPYKTLGTVPLILLQLLYAWYTGKPLGQSLCQIYANMLEVSLTYTLKTSENYGILWMQTEQTTTEYLQCFTDASNCIQHWQFLSCIGQFAYDGLFDEDKVSKLDLDRSSAGKIISESDLAFADEAGILIQSVDCDKDSSGLYHNLSFVHRSYHEFLAALHIAVGNISPEDLFCYCNSAEKLLDLSKMFIFLSGMSPAMMSKFYDGLTCIISNDSIVQQYRNSSNNECDFKVWTVKRLQDMMVACLEENRRCGNGDIDIRLPIADIIIDINDALINSRGGYMSLLDYLMRSNTNNLKTVCVRHLDKEIVLDELKVFGIQQLQPSCTQRGCYNLKTPEILSHLSQCYFLTGLHLSGCNIDGILSSVTSMHCIESLTVEEVTVSYIKVTDLFDYIARQKGIRELCLSDIRFSDSYDRIQAQHYTLGLSILERLQVLRLRFVFGGMDVSLELPASMSDLEICEINLELSPSQITALASSKYLKKLDICCVNTDSGHADAVLEVLPQLQCLTHVTLHNFQIEQKILDVTNLSKQLEFICFKYVKISSESFSRFVLSLKEVEQAVKVILELCKMDKLYRVKQCIKEFQDFVIFEKITIDDTTLCVHFEKTTGIRLLKKNTDCSRPKEDYQNVSVIEDSRDLYKDKRKKIFQEYISSRIPF